MESERIYQCEVCPKVYSRRDSFRKHKRKKHPTMKLESTDLRYNYYFNGEIYSCNTCDMECEDKSEIEKHVLVHNDKENFNCNTCGLNFDRAYKFSLHMFTHIHEYECPFCQYTTTASTSMRTHINRVHYKKFKYQCEHCAKCYDDVTAYKEHLAHHTTGYVVECIVCNKQFSFSRNLITHQIRVHTVHFEGIVLPNQCYICKRKYAKKETLLNHMETHNTSKPHKKTHLCDICGMGFSRKDKLTIHYRVHTGEKPFECSHCEKSFTKRDYLIMHQRIHTGDKPYSCEFCGKCFNQGAPLRIHVRSHTGEKPYKCLICCNGFVSKGALNSHMKVCGL